MSNRKIKIRPKQLIVPAVRLFFFLLYPALFSTAFTGVKSLIIWIAEQKSLEWNSFTATLLALIAVTICFGRIFCGFACAFGTYGDALYFVSSWIRKKQKKKPFHVFERQGKYLKYLKYLVLLVTFVLCVFGMQGVIAENSPWTAFSRLQTGHIPDAAWGIALLAVISVGMLLEPRFFCRFLCPMGAVFAMLPVLPPAVIKRNRENCIPGCSLCQRRCPAGIEIPDAASGDSTGMGECFACRKCMHGCPKKNIHTLCRKKMVNEKK